MSLQPERDSNLILPQNPNFYLPREVLFPDLVDKLMRDFNYAASSILYRKVDLDPLEFVGYLTKRIVNPTEGNVIIFPKQGDRVHLIRRTKMPTGVGGIGGKVKKGEPFDVAALRETYEELHQQRSTGLNLLSLVHRTYVCGNLPAEEQTAWLAYFCMEIPSGMQLHLDAHEAVLEELHPIIESVNIHDPVPEDMISHDKEIFETLKGLYAV